jgi:phage-related protein
MTLAELVIKISCDSSNAVKGIEDTEKKASKLGGLASKVGSGVSAMGKVAATATAAATAAIGKIVISATKAYAQYEQLTGGVETLFKDSSKEVIKYAQEAYKTAGVDANRYMETVTSFSASLLQSMGKDTKEAAKVADMAMRDMSDNAHKMGTDMASIEAAYKGFAKQNYTMLDNLKLGYGGTRKEMQRLLKDASKLTGKKYNINNLKDVYEAIHAIQEELGITGTTAKEAETTIQGSFEMMKASWENLKIAMADPNGDIGAALGNVVESVKIFAGNVIPVVSQTIKGISSAIKELAPVLAEELPTLLSDILPDMVSAAVDLVGGIADAIIQNAPAIIDGFGQIFQKVGEKLESSDNPIAQGFGKLISFVGDMIRDPEGTLLKAWDTIKDVAGKAWEAIKKAASDAWSAVQQWWSTNISEPLSQAWGSVQGTFEEIWTAIQTAADNAWSSVSQFWQDMKSSISTAWSVVGTWFESTVWNPIADAATNAWNAVKQWWQNKKSQISAAWSTVGTWFSQTVWEPVTEAVTNAWAAVSQWWEDKKSQISSAWATVGTWFQNTVWTPVTTAVSDAWTAVSKWWEDKRSSISAAWGSVGSWFKNTVWTPVSSAVSTAWDAVTKWWNENVYSKISAAWDAVAGIFQPLLDVINGIVDGINTLIGKNGQHLSTTYSEHDHKVVTTYETLGTPPPGAVDQKKVLETGFDAFKKLFGFAKGNWSVPYDDYPALLHRNEMVLTASQARGYREGKTPNGGAGGIGDIGSLIVQAIKEGMKDVSVNSYLDGRDVTDVISRIMGNDMTSRRFA